MTAVLTDAADALRELGCVVEPAPLPGMESIDATAVSAVLFTAEVVPYFRRITTGREADLHPVLQRTINAPEVLLADYVAAQQQVDALSSLFDGYFEHYDALLCPVCPVPAPPHAQADLRIGAATVPARGIMRATVPFNLTGLPPCHCRSAPVPATCPSVSNSSPAGMTRPRSCVSALPSRPSARSAAATPTCGPDTYCPRSATRRDSSPGNRRSISSRRSSTPLRLP